MGIDQVNVIGHSMGGMLAVRFALMCPKMTEKLILENPIGLEDYQEKVPYITVDQWIKQITNISATQIEAHQRNYYTIRSADYQPWADVQVEALTAKDSDNVALTSAVLYGMIYTQPIFTHHVHRIKGKYMDCIYALH